MEGRREFAAEPATDEQTGRASVVIGRLWHTARPADAPFTGSAADAFVGDPAAAVAVAFETVPADLERLAEDLRAKALVEPAQIVEASVLIARDPELRATVDREVAEWNRAASGDDAGR